MTLPMDKSKKLSVYVVEAHLNTESKSELL